MERLERSLQQAAHRGSTLQSGRESGDGEASYVAKKKPSEGPTWALDEIALVAILDGAVVGYHVTYTYRSWMELCHRSVSHRIEDPPGGTQAKCSYKSSPIARPTARGVRRIIVPTARVGTRP